jgi:hypothetical protein
LYSKTLRSQALQLLAEQIKVRHTTQLVTAIVTWPLDEMALILGEILLRILPGWKKWVRVDSRSSLFLNPCRPDQTTTWVKLIEQQLPPLYPQFPNAFRYYSDPLITVVQFVAEIAKASSCALKPLADLGFLDHAVGVYISYNSESKSRVDLLTAYDVIVSAFYADPVAVQVILGHPVHILWWRDGRLSQEHLSGRSLQRRNELWRSLKQDAIIWRLRVITLATIITRQEEEPSLPEVYDALVDLLEFSRYSEPIPSATSGTYHFR